MIFFDETQYIHHYEENLDEIFYNQPLKIHTLLPNVSLLHRNRYDIYFLNKKKENPYSEIFYQDNQLRIEYFFYHLY